MATFLVEHQHTDEMCPADRAESVEMMGELVLGADRQSSFGVKLLSDYVIRGRHTLLLFLEAENRKGVEDYAEPLSWVGRTEVYELTHCAAIMQEVLSGSGKSGCSAGTDLEAMNILKE